VRSHWPKPFAAGFEVLAMTAENRSAGTPSERGSDQAKAWQTLGFRQEWMNLDLE
jgi:hypothetical protein